MGRGGLRVGRWGGSGGCEIEGGEVRVREAEVTVRMRVKLRVETNKEVKMEVEEDVER